MSEIKTSLYIVPTPIGNLEDMTFRAISVLKEVDCILAEDTRTSGVLMKHFDISTKLISHHQHNEHKTAPALMERMKKGEVYALVSDAGTPGISDPGFLLARTCIENGLKVECLPGATAFVPALVKSGLPTDRFVFEGFLPQKKGRHTRLTQLAEEERSIVFYESPHRIHKTLEQLVEYFGKDRIVSVSREISKLHEETVTDTLENVIVYYATHPCKGELVVILAGKEPVKEKKSKYKDEE